MERSKKFLRKLTRDERNRVEKCIKDILAGSTEYLDIKKLKGYRDFYRARVGDIRILFTKKGSVVRIIAVERRGEQTYK